MSNTEGSGLSDRLDVTPAVLKSKVRDFYASLNIYLRGGELDKYVQFFNWGYEPVDGLPDDWPRTLPPEMMDRHATRLVLELVGQTDLEGRDVLDIGCGRGGTLATFLARFSPRSLTGIDLTAMSIEHCRRAHQAPNLSFFEGDAEDLAFGDDCFDVVTNIESSNAYPQIDNFYREVNRVLRIGGLFLYTDLLTPQQFLHARDFLGRNGFALEQDRDITANVLAARRVTAETQLRSFNAAAGNGVEQDLMDYFIAPEGSVFFDSIEKGSFSYRILRFRKFAACNIF